KETFMLLPTSRTVKTLYKDDSALERAVRNVGLAIILLAAAASVLAQDLPNIIIIYADDLGYGDLSAYNSKAACETPRLDQMAAEGIRFTDAHSPSTICSPSRYGLYSGQQIFRTGRASRAFEGPGGPSYIKPGELTIAEILKQQGYRTGVFGKWHVGLTWYDKSGKRLGGGFENSLLIDYERSTPLEDGPNKKGFDESFITPNCPTTDPLYIYIENGMVPTPASQRHKRESLPNPGGGANLHWIGECPIARLDDHPEAIDVRHDQVVPAVGVHVASDIDMGNLASARRFKVGGHRHKLAFRLRFGIEPVQAAVLVGDQPVAPADLGHIDEQHLWTQRCVEFRRPGAALERIDAQAAGLTLVDVHHGKFRDSATEKESCQNGRSFR
ncbi:MAG: sulfatase-like hydrolase/transferase, partial [Verrucomicrobia bacterium]|nr:sulfatase-like hydrolase/transferase [Verrucomicrobiota bacterium]